MRTVGPAGAHSAIDDIAPRSKETATLYKTDRQKITAVAEPSEKKTKTNQPLKRRQKKQEKTQALKYKEYTVEMKRCGSGTARSYQRLHDDAPACVFKLKNKQTKQERTGSEP